MGHDIAKINAKAAQERSILNKKEIKDGYKPKDENLRALTATFLFDKNQDGIIAGKEFKKIDAAKYKEETNKIGNAFGVPCDERKNFFPEYGYLLDAINKKGDLNEKDVEEILEASKKPNK